MKTTTYEATVENGQIKILSAVRLPENAKVYVVVPDPEEGSRFRVATPHLARPEQMADFIMEVAEEWQDADPAAS